MARRLDWLLRGSAWISLTAAALGGCSGDPFTPGVGGSGTGAGGTTSSPSSSSGGGAGDGASTSSSGAGGCTQTSDCPTPSTAGQCEQAAKCENNTCTVVFVPGPAKSQKYGDCMKGVCDDEGKVVMMPDDSDFYDDGNDCTDDLCQNGKPINPTKLNFMCGGDGSICAIVPGATYASCLACNPANLMSCGPTAACSRGKCVPLHCQDGIADSGESGVDCGGLECNPCMPGGGCNSHIDCASDICTNGKCATPSCSDTHKNGAETDEDCGGNCPPCMDNLHCITQGDCKSQVCFDNKCLPPTCTDGVKNGNEEGIDCGGTCPACP